jgi:hypothetical protein
MNIPRWRLRSRFEIRDSRYESRFFFFFFFFFESITVRLGVKSLFSALVLDFLV